MSLNVRQIPIFAFPSSLKFYLGTRSSHTQVLTLYSPYDFPIKYKVHCHSSAWDKYIVPTPEGTIPGQSSVDLVVTHKQAVPANCNVLDRFKIVIQDPVTEQIIGRKTVDSILLPGERDSRFQHEDDFEFHSQEDSSSRSVHAHAQTTTRTVQHSSKSSNPSGNSFVSSIIIAACATILFLPTEPEVVKPSNLPNYLHVSHKIQLLAALLLGVFLCILVRS